MVPLRLDMMRWFPRLVVLGMLVFLVYGSRSGIVRGIRFVLVLLGRTQGHVMVPFQLVSRGESQPHRVSHAHAHASDEL